MPKSFLIKIGANRTMGFGKYKEKPVTIAHVFATDRSYVKWMFDNITRPNAAQLHAMQALRQLLDTYGVAEEDEEECGCRMCMLTFC